MNNESTNLTSQKIGIFTEIDYLVIVNCSCCLMTFFTLSIIDMYAILETFELYARQDNNGNKK